MPNEEERGVADQEEQRDFFDAMPQLGWVARPDGSIRYYNRRWYEYTGTAPDEMKDWGWQAVHRPDVLPEVLERWRSAIAAELPFEMSFPLRRHDGVFRWFLTRAVPTRDAHGNVEHWIGINTDIDDQKNAETALADAVRAREELLAMVSHDLRNPMNAALMAATQIEFLTDEGPPGDRVRKSTGIIKRAIDRMNRLVSDLLDLSRLEANKRISIEIEGYDLIGVVEQTIEATEPLAQSRKLRVETEIGAAPIWADCDGGRIRQVLENLLGNAIKFTREGGSICVGLQKTDREALFYVRDSGVGIKEEQLPHIFSAYWQGDTHRKRGVGLGLAIVKAIIDAHGGRVWAESKPDAGSTFHFAIPLAPKTTETTEPR